MAKRRGPFWDGIEGRAPIPAAARTLGFEFLSADPEAGTIEVAFTAGEEFTNPAGNVLGAFLAAMLYDVLGPALLATLDADQFQSTLQMNVTFLRPTRPGRILGRGGVVHRHGDNAVLEAALFAPTERVRGDDTRLATATALARVISYAEAPTAV